MQVDHRLLYRMKAVDGEVVDTDDFAAVGLPRQDDAGIDRAVDQPAADPPPQHHRARTAVAFGAAFLGAHGTLGQPEIIEQSQRGGGVAETHDCTPSQELNVTTHDRLAPPARPKPSANSGSGGRR